MTIDIAALKALATKIENLPALDTSDPNWTEWEGYRIQSAAARLCGWTTVECPRDEGEAWIDPTGQPSSQPMCLLNWEGAYALLEPDDRTLELRMTFSKDGCWPATVIRWMERDETNPNHWMALIVRGATPQAALTAAALTLRWRQAEYALKSEAGHRLDAN